MSYCATFKDLKRLFFKQSLFKSNYVAFMEEKTYRIMLIKDRNSLRPFTYGHISLSDPKYQICPYF